MKLPRNVRIFRGQLDVAPFATVFLLLILFLVIGGLAYTPGVHVSLPATTDSLPGTDKPTISVALDQNGRLYYENHWIDQNSLLGEFRKAKTKADGPLVLVVQADKNVTCEKFLNLAMLARKAGIYDSLLATLKTTNRIAAAAP